MKEDAAFAIRELKQSGIRKTVMLTGDAKAVGENVARRLGLDEVYTELLPADKVSHMEQLLSQTSEKGKLAFVGDGINDAPVLTVPISALPWADSAPTRPSKRPMWSS